MSRWLVMYRILPFYPEEEIVVEAVTIYEALDVADAELWHKHRTDVDLVSVREETSDTV